MAKSLMLKSVYAEFDGKACPVLVDLGNVNEQATRDRGDALMAFGLSRKRFSIEGFNRLLVELPPRKVQAILGAFPIVEGSTYWRTTHHWHELPAAKEDARHG